jgi:ribonucleoside-diphosphate reductase alpha chain
MQDDSIDRIYDTLKQTAKSLNQQVEDFLYTIRATGSYIRGTNGTSNGIVLCWEYSMIQHAMSIKGGKRKGSFAIYIETWHADFDFRFEKE